MMWLGLFLVFPVVVLLVLLFVKREIVSENHQAKSKVSIIIAVRDEEDNLPELFEALERLNFPSEQLEILFGNDDSSDGSLSLMQGFASGKKNVTVYEILPTDVQEAKANVLMQLCEKAEGEFMLFLDADISPNPELINNYLSHWKEGYGGITGVTLPETASFGGKMQRVDWCLSLGMGYDAQCLGQDITAMGNNMFVSRSVYESIGGYRALPKSVVEDFTLYKNIRNKGIEFPILFTPDLLAKTQAISGLGNLLKQRKRWMKGGMQLAWFMKIALVLQGLYYPVGLILLFLYPVLGLALMSVKTFVQMIYIAKQFKRLKLEIPWSFLFFYEIYNCIFTILLLIYFALPIKVNWKNREYGNH